MKKWFLNIRFDGICVFCCILFAAVMVADCGKPEIFEPPFEQGEGENESESEKPEEPEILPDPESDPNPDSESVPDPDTDQDPNPEPEPDADQDPEPEPSPDPDPLPDPKPEPDVDENGGIFVPGTFFVSGVTKDSGWYDVNKKRNGFSDGDFLLCWAASASCMLQWWQDNYKAHGHELPEGTPDGPGEYYELDIFEAMKPNFVNQGAKTDLGIHWYFTGEDRHENWQGHNAPKPGTGGYFRPVFDGIESELGGDAYCENITGYYIWGNGRPDYNRSSHEILSEYMLAGLRDGIVGLTLKVAYSAFHDVVLWGCDVDADGLVTAVWFTDSDDLMSRPDAPRKQVLHYLELRDKGGKVCIIGHFSGDVEVSAITTLKAYPPTK